MRSSNYQQITDELLSAYLDGVITPEEYQLIDAAVADDEEIAWRLESLRQTIALLGTLPQPDPGRNFTLTPEQVAQGPVLVESQVEQRVKNRPAASSTPSIGETGGGFWQEFLAGWRDIWYGGNLTLRNAAAMSLALMLVLFGVSAYRGLEPMSEAMVSAPASQAADSTVADASVAESTAAEESVALAPTEPAEALEAANEAGEEADGEEQGESSGAGDGETADDAADETPLQSDATLAEAETPQDETVQDEADLAESTGDEAAAASASVATAQEAVEEAPVPDDRAENSVEAPEAQAAMAAPEMESVPPSMIIPNAPGDSGGRGGGPIDGMGGGLGSGGGGDGIGAVPEVPPSARLLPTPDAATASMPATEESSTTTSTEAYAVAEAEEEAAEEEATEEKATDEPTAGKMPAEEPVIDADGADDASDTTPTAEAVAIVAPSPAPTTTPLATPVAESALATPANMTDEAANAPSSDPAVDSADSASADALERSDDSSGMAGFGLNRLPLLAIAQAGSLLLTLMLLSLWWRSRKR